MTEAYAATGARPEIRPIGQPGDLGWTIQAHGELYATEFGWNTDFEALVAGIVADYAKNSVPDRDAGWIATLDGERVGCVLCVREDDETAKLRILLVHPKARGHGLGERLVTTCLDFARTAGYRRITLWTNSVLDSARRIYRSQGFRLVDENRHHSFGQDLLGQNWSREL